MRPRILVLSLGWEQVPMLDMLGSMDVDIFGVHYNEDHYTGIEYQETIIAEMLDWATISAFADRVQPTAVISDQDDYAYITQAAIAERFHLPGPKKVTAELGTNKYLQRNKCSQNGIRQPIYHKVAVIEDVIRFANSHGFPIILKPVDSRGSFGVSKISEASEIEEAFTAAKENSVSGDMIVEQFIEGFEITIDGFCFNGQPKSLSLAKKGKISAKKQVSVDIKYPGEMADAVYAKAMTNNERVSKALGFDFGMVHSEYIVTETGSIFLVEAANRGGGCFTSEIIVPNVCGVDILKEFVENCFGRIHHETPPVSIDKTEVILKFITLGPGKIKSFQGFDNIKANKSVLQFRMAVKEGDEIAEVTNDANRHGFIIVKAEKNVRQLADDIIDSITVNYY